MHKSVMINAAVSLAISTSIALCAIVFVRQHVREDVDRSIQDREERFVSQYRERVLKLRRDFGMPDKPVTTLEDVFEPLITLAQ